MASRVLTGMAVCLGLVLLAGQAMAQLLTVSPPCGKRGETVVAMVGSGWPEPSPPCEYLFLFDGVEVAPRQPDGIEGPPVGSFQVPLLASIGMHTVRVELRLQEDGSLIKWCQVPFKVVDQHADPWKVKLINSGQIEIKFNPQDACDRPQCEHIFLIQTVRTTGSGPSQPPRPIYPSECGFPSSLNADQDAEGNAVDERPGSRDPYYNGRDVHRDDRGPETGQGANTSQNQFPSEMTDEPRIADADFPPGFDTINMEFEVNVYCESGAAAGEWLGRYTWSWTRTKGSPGGPFGQATLGPPGTRQQPSTTFQQTLDNWRTNPNHPWKKSKPTSSPGATCGP